MRIHFDEVTVRRNDRAILDSLSIEMEERRIGVIGSNGSGKSTFLRLLNALVTADAGRISVNGLNPARDAARVRRAIGFVFQDPEAQIVMPTVAEEVAFGLKSLKLERDESDRRIREELRRFGLDGRESDSAHLLSGGEKQRLALASILAMKPDILVMDEPTAMLDLPGRLDLAHHLEHMPQPVILATHDLSLLEGFERVVVLHEGRIVEDAAPAAAIRAYEARVLKGRKARSGAPPIRSAS